MIPLLLLLTAVAVPPPNTVAEQRNAMRDACAKIRGNAPETAATRATFKRCVEQIRYDGDLPSPPKLPMP